MEKKIYTLEEACATKETGAYFPQISKMAKGYDYDAPNSIYNFSKFVTEIPAFEPNFNHFILNGKSKRSDILSNSLLGSFGFVLNLRTKFLLEKFSLPTHKFYKIIIKQADIFLEDYYYCRIYCDLSEEVNYSESLFQIEKADGTKIKEIVVNSKEEYLQKKEMVRIEAKKIDEYYFLWAKKLSFIKKPEYDLFSVNGTFDNSIYIKNSLRDALIENKITGIEMKLSDKMIF